MTRNEQVAAAAEALIGTRFRLHGRDPATGLDCVGLAAASLAAAGQHAPVPTGYALRGGRPDVVAAMIDARLDRVADLRAGTLLLAVSGPGQLHLAIIVDGGLVHADAGLRRVVMRPGPPPWPVIGGWRARAREE